MRDLAIVLALLVFLAAPAAAQAAGPLVCAIVDVFDCSAGDCTEVTSEAVGVPDLLRLDPGKKTLTGLDREFGRAATPLASLASEGGKTTARASHEDRSLALVVEDESGDAMLTVTDHKVTLVAYGECAAP